MEMGIDMGNKGEEGLFWDVSNVSLIRELLSLSILVFEKFTFYKTEESLVTSILGVLAV